MNDLARRPVLCTRCYSSGLDPASEPCARCKGVGSFPRLLIRIRVVPATDLLRVAEPSFLRLAVLSAEPAGDEVVVSGVTETGLVLVAAIRADRFAQVQPCEYIEKGWSW